MNTKKQLGKRLLSVWLAVIMTVGLLPTTAFAATTRTVNSASELQSAISSASSGDTIKLGANITFSDAKQIQTVRDVYQDRKNLTYELPTARYQLYESFTMIGINFDWKLYQDWTAMINDYQLPEEFRPEHSSEGVGGISASDLRMRNGKLADQNGNTLYVHEDGDAATYLLIDGKNLTIDLGGYTISGTHNDAYFSTLFVSGGATVTIKGSGGITSSQTAITANGKNTTVNIQSGSFTGNTTVASIYQAKVNITGGTFTGGNAMERVVKTTASLDTEHVRTEAVADGNYIWENITLGAGTAYKKISQYRGTASRTINCATLYCENYGTINVSGNPTVKAPAGGTLFYVTNSWTVGMTSDFGTYISGGTFEGSMKKGSACATGGTFSENPHGVVTGLNGVLPSFRDCMVQRFNDGKYGVITKEEWDSRGYVASINGVGYVTLAEAVSNAQNGDTIELLKDLAGEQNLSGSKTCTINLRGYTINGNVTVKSGDVTITNGTINYTGTGNALKTEGNSAVLTANCTVNAPSGTALSAGYGSAGGKVTTLGGRYTGKLGTAGGGVLSLTGGKYSSDPKSYLPEGYSAEKGSDNYYSIKAALNAEGFMLIRTLSDLQNFATQVSDGNETLNAILMADIDLANSGWTPIGNANNYGYYNGTFDGNGYKIKNLNVTIPDGQYPRAGFFARVGKTGIIKNLRIDSGKISGTGFRAVVGGIAGDNYGTIQNCSNAANISVERYGTTDREDAANIHYVGGIAGGGSGTIERCYNEGAISAFTYDNYYVGGITAACNVKNCYNTGKITGRYSVCGVGGNASNCFNWGELACTGDLSDKFAPSGYTIYPVSSGSGEKQYYRNTSGASGNTPGSAQAKSDQDFSSGAVTWELNNESAWYQNLTGCGRPIDAHPVLDPTHLRVYKTSNGTYTNDSFKEVVQPNDINVNYSTATEILARLPDAVTVKTNLGFTATIDDVEWDMSASGYDPLSTEAQTITVPGKVNVSYLTNAGEKPVKIKVTIGAPSISGLNLVTAPSLIYDDGTALNLSGVGVSVTYENGAVGRIDETTEGVTFNIANGTTLNKNTHDNMDLNLTYKSKSVKVGNLDVRSTDNTIQTLTVGGQEASYQDGAYTVTLTPDSSLPSAESGISVELRDNSATLVSRTKVSEENGTAVWQITVRAENGAEAVYPLHIDIAPPYGDQNQAAIDEITNKWNALTESWTVTQAEIQRDDVERPGENPAPPYLTHAEILQEWLSGQVYVALAIPKEMEGYTSIEVTIDDPVSWATEGKRDNHAGTNGSFSFTVMATASQGSSADYKTATFTGSGTITATPYDVPGYTVNFDSQGGSTVDSMTISEDTPIGSENAPTDPTRADYRFTGWYKEANCTTPWNMDKDKVTANPTTLYAGWSWSKTETTVDSIQHTVPDPGAGAGGFLMGDAVTITASARLVESTEPTTLTDDAASFRFYNGDPANSGTLIGTVPANGSMAEGFTVTLETTLTSGHGFEKNGAFTIYAVFSGNTALSESVGSENLTIGTLTYPTPAAPQVATAAERSITLNVTSAPDHATVEYGYVEGTDGGAPSTWQASPVFTNLNPGTAYIFYVRFAANAYYEETKTSDPSEMVYTLPEITGSLPNGALGVPYSATLTATPANVNWSVTGSLPYGLTLNDGTISGTPAGAGNFNFTVTVTTQDGITNSQQFAIYISPGTPDPGEIGTYLGDTAETTFTYGQTITVKGAIIPAASNSINLIEEPAQDQVALFYHGIQLTRSVTVGGDGSFILTYPTGEGGIPIGANQEITVRFGGSLDLNAAEIPLTITLNRASGPAFPAALTNAYDTDTDTTFAYTMPYVAGAEYSMDGENWQSSNVFGGIEPQSTHTFYARMAETSTHEAGAETSITVVFDLLKNTNPIQLEVSVSGESGSRTVTIAPVTGAEYSFDGGSTWGEDNEKQLDSDAPITVAIRYKETDTHAASDALTETLDPSKQPQEALDFAPIGNKTYGDASFTLFITGGSGDGEVTYVSLDPDVISIDGDVATIHKAGPARLQATKAGDDQYNARTAETTVTVVRRPLTITAVSEQLTVGDTMPELTFTVSGLVNGDTFVDPTISCPVSDTSVAGQYAISISGGTLTNGDSYDIRYQNGVLTIETVAPTIYTVIFNSVGGTLVGAQSIIAGERVREPAAPTKEGYHFAGWYSDPGYNNAWSFSDPVTQNLNLYAKWDSKPVYEIDGSVTGYGSAVGIEITLKRGNTIVYRTKTNSEGKYHFARVAPGIYNIVAQRTVNQNGQDVQQAVTILVEIVDHNAQAPDIQMPPTNVNSVLKLLSNAPEIMVGGLNDEAVAAATGDGGLTTDIVTVSMEITPQPLVTGTPEPDGEKAQLQQEQNAIQQTAPGKTLNFMEFEVVKTVAPSAGGDPQKKTITETQNVLEIVVAFDFTSKQNVQVYRYHNGAAEALTPAVGKSSPVDGTYYLDSANGLIHIFAQKYSLYAIGYTVPAPSGGGNGGGGGGGGGNVSTYSITIKDSDHGKVTSSSRNASSGSTITLTATPDEGYRLEEITVTDSSGRKLELTSLGNGKYSFKMPAWSVVVTANFQEEAHTQPWVNPFTDVAEGAWYYDAVRFASENGLMGGYGNGLFGPNDNLSRAQFAQILFNKEGRPVVNYLMQFDDVADEAWYTEAIRWAASQGIVSGYGNGTFGPNDNITREQLAVMLWRYAGSPAATEKELHFTDADKVSGYALEALCWAVENGVINGYGNGQLAPQGLATRAQVAQMLKNFIETQEENT